jgi:hypothetical protein
LLYQLNFITIIKINIKMGKLNIKKEVMINVPATVAWELVGPGFINVSNWGRGVNSSWLNESAIKNFEEAPAGGRVCDVSGFGTVKEGILHYDSQKFEISWSANSDKIPGFVSKIRNDVKVEVIDENSCRVSINITADISGVMGFLMGGVMKKNFSKVMSGFLKDLKIYAETGQISEKKKSELAKA